MSLTECAYINGYSFFLYKESNSNVINLLFVVPPTMYGGGGLRPMLILWYGILCNHLTEKRAIFALF